MSNEASTLDLRCAKPALWGQFAIWTLVSIAVAAAIVTKGWDWGFDNLRPPVFGAVLLTVNWAFVLKDIALAPRFDCADIVIELDPSNPGNPSIIPVSVSANRHLLGLLWNGWHLLQVETSTPPRTVLCRTRTNADFKALAAAYPEL